MFKFAFVIAVIGCLTAHNGWYVASGTSLVAYNEKSMLKLLAEQINGDKEEKPTTPMTNGLPPLVQQPLPKPKPKQPTDKQEVEQLITTKARVGASLGIGYSHAFEKALAAAEVSLRYDAMKSVMYHTINSANVKKKSTYRIV